MLNKEKINKIEGFYIVAFLIYLLLNSIVPYIMIEPKIIRNLISIFFMMTGGIIVIYNIFFEKEKFIKNYAWLLSLFIIICLISSVLMIKYGYLNNIKTIIWSCILYGVIYTYAMKNNKIQIRKIIKILIILLSIIWMISIIIGIYQYIMQISYHIKLENGVVTKAQGFYYNRLFGIFVDPNFAATTSVILLFASIYVFNTTNKKFEKLIWIFNIILQFIYIILSGSRTGLVILFVGSVIYISLKLISYFKNKKRNNIIKIVISILISFVFIIILFILVKAGLEYIPNLINNNNAVASSNNDVSNNIKEKSGKVNLDRTDLSNKGISNLRFELWGDCLEILKSKPLFGTSPRNLIPYAKDVYPQTYPAKGYDYGNGFLAVLVGTGIIGTTIILTFLLACGKKIFSYIVKFKYQNDSEQKELNILAISIVIMLLIAAFINQEVFLINSINTAIFWLMLGYLMMKVNEKEPRMEKDKNKVGIVTIHDADNYGSALQAYATQKIISNLGYNAIIVDHICKKISKEYGLKRIFAQKNIKSIIETIVRIITIYPSRIKFKKFREEFFNEQDEESVIKNQNEFTKFLVGSDQVWNYKITDFDKAYFLDFVNDNHKKISYASSFGITEIPEDKKEDYKNLLKEFEHIAVREEQAIKIVKNLTGRDVETVLDPTLLINKEEWKEIVKTKKHEKNYILCYQIAYSQSLVDFAQELAKKTNKKIISIQGSMRHRFNAKYIWDAGPVEYINLFLNADYIITNSFHGTAFSINFNKNFFTELLPSFEKTSSRLESILDLFELRSRQIINGKNDNMLKDINYEKQNEILIKNRKQSIEILKTFLKENEE